MEYSYLLIFKADPLALSGLAMILCVYESDGLGNPSGSLQTPFAFIRLTESLVMLSKMYLIVI